MAGQIISIVIGLAIVYLAARALVKSFKDAKAGKCAGCHENCSSCSPEIRDK